MMTTRDAHARSSHFSPVSLTVDAPLRSVCSPAFRIALTDTLASLRCSVAALLTNLLTQTTQEHSDKGRCALRIVGGETMTMLSNKARRMSSLVPIIIWFAEMSDFMGSDPFQKVGMAHLARGDPKPDSGNFVIGGFETYPVDLKKSEHHIYADPFVAVDKSVV